MIGLDATYAVDRQPTGVGVYSRELMAGLARVAADREFHAYVRLHRFRRSLDEPWPPVFHRRPLVDFLAPSARVFHGLNQRLPARKRGRFVVTFHDLFVMTAEYSTPEFRARFTQQAREAAERADLAICISDFTAGQVESLLGVERARLRVIPHGVHPAPRSEGSEPLILHVGAIQQRKNLVRLVEAFERLPDSWRLALVGGSGYGAEQVMEKIGASPARERILISGYAAPDELEDWYRRARIFAFPSLDEGFGMPILDAMARGLPVVTANRSATVEVAGDAAVLVDPFSVESIHEAMVAAERDREALVERGLKRALLFSWDESARQTLRVYDETT
jgi:glycosyltransferase involved in cell wall biosynthesis